MIGRDRNLTAARPGQAPPPRRGLGVIGAGFPLQRPPLRGAPGGATPRVRRRSASAVRQAGPRLRCTAGPSPPRDRRGPASGAPAVRPRRAPGPVARLGRPSAASGSARCPAADRAGERCRKWWPRGRLRHFSGRSGVPLPASSRASAGPSTIASRLVPVRAHLSRRQSRSPTGAGRRAWALAPGGWPTDNPWREVGADGRLRAVRIQAVPSCK